VNKPGIWYVLKGSCGFYSDSDWDGDCFGPSPWYARVTTEPTSGGRGGEYYTCTKVRLYTEDHGPHVQPSMREVMTHKHGRPKMRYRLECPRCKATTKLYAEKSVAVSRYNEIHGAGHCIDYKWEEVKP
jgi:hypothetical protein